MQAQTPSQSDPVHSSQTADGASPAAQTAGTPASPAVAKKKGKVTVSHKPLYGKLAYRLPKGLDKAVRYAALRLEDVPNAPQTPLEVIEKAVRNYIDLLQSKGKFSFPQDILDSLVGQ